MDKTRSTPIAEILVTSYLETGSFSRDFRDQWGYPPTILAKSHYLRSAVQAQIADLDGFDLGERYVEFGRVEVTDLSTGKRYVLQSERTLAIEQRVRQWDRLFDPDEYLRSGVLMLVYSFGEDGLILSLAGTMQRPGRQRLYAAGPPSLIHTWSYDTGQPEPFDQGDAGDAFGDLGDVGMGDEDEAEG